MTIEDTIAELLAQAEPLRKLDDDDTAKAPLGGIVDQINALRKEQSKPTFEDQADERNAAAEVKRGIEDAYGRPPNPGEVEFFLPKKRGRPAKIEGDDA